MATPSLAREFFDRITSSPDPAAFIEALVDLANPTFETDWLDLKSQPRTDQDCRKIWCKALSGMANNQGGVLIWGIDGRKDAGDKIDCARELKPIRNPAAFKSRLIELQRGATDPPLANVVIEYFELASTPGEGFVVCFIPQGELKPYRTEDGAAQYYLRAGDSCKPMSRSVLQTMFYPRVHPSFRIVSWLTFEPEARGDSAGTMSCVARILNVGRATAKECFVILRTLVDAKHPLQFETASWAWETGIVDGNREFRAHRSLHPGRYTPLFTAQWGVATQIILGEHPRKAPLSANPTFEFRVYCENHDEQVVRVTFDMEDVIHCNTCVREASATA
jgi:hypothetical protein